MNFKKLICLLLCFIISSFCFTGCDSNNDYVLYFELDSAPKTLDPQLASGTSEELLIKNLFEGLMRENSKGEIVNGMAKDYLVSSTLTGVIAQRLVRRLCDNCKEAYIPTEEEARHISANIEVQNRLMQTKLYRKKGCKECGYLGYTGRIGIYEVMPITREIKKLIAQGAHDIEIEEAAVAVGMKTLKESCLNHILEGNTSSSEFIRVLGYANE